MIWLIGAPIAASAVVALLVGPEGGWSEEERAGLNRRGWQALGLGSRVLRTETAAVVGVARLVMFR